MNKQLQKFIKDNRDTFLESLPKDWSINASTIAQAEPVIKDLHRRCLGLAVLSSVMGHEVPQGNYVNAIPEVSFLSVVLAVKGLENPAYVLMRQSIELAFKHVYFATHAVEYGWCATRLGYREISFQFLLEYSLKTDEIQSLRDGSDLVKRLEGEYHILSRYVHVHSDLHMRFAEPFVQSNTNKSALDSFIERSREVWPRLCLLLISAFPQRFIKSTAGEQSLIRHSLPTEFRTMLNSHLRDISLNG